MTVTVEYRRPYGLTLTLALRQPIAVVSWHIEIAFLRTHQDGMWVVKGVGRAP